jgi:hypothetical protein
MSFMCRSGDHDTSTANNLAVMQMCAPLLLKREEAYILSESDLQSLHALVVLSRRVAGC